MCSSDGRCSFDAVSTITQGNAAESAVLHAMTVAGVHVLIPFGSGLPFDLAVVVGEDERILRIQVKCGRVRGACVRFNTCSTDHGKGRLPYRERADVIAVYVQELDGVFVVPVEDCPGYVGSLRLEPALNNQRIGVRRAKDYTLEAWLARVQVAASDWARDDDANPP